MNEQPVSLDSLVDAFDEQWSTGNPPELQEFIKQYSEPTRSNLLRNLIPIDVEYRTRRGEEVQSNDYAALGELAVQIACEEIAQRSSLIEKEHLRGDKTSRLLIDTQGIDTAKTIDPSQTRNVPGYSQIAIGPMRYRVLHAHRKGGLGKVSIAEDMELSRHVALKEIQERFSDNAEVRARFIREAEITGRLEHPGIVPIYGLGAREDGSPYYAMRFIHGKSFEEEIELFHSRSASKGEISFKTGPVSISFRELLGRFISVCEAMHYAHSRGIIHRDLKPANIMVGEFGETLVVDWGLAKRLPRSSLPNARRESVLGVNGDECDDRTIQGSVVGTPAYMSPEQARGESEDLTEPTDIYSLGATLYQVLVGQPPFVNYHSLSELVCDIEAGKFPQPRRVNAAIPSPLEAICLKAMKPEVSGRYSNAKSLAEDIKRWMADEPVDAYHESKIEKLSRFVRKNQAKVALVGMLLLSVISIYALRIWYVNQIAIAEGERERQRIIARAFEQNANEQQLFAQVNSIQEQSARRPQGWSWKNLEQIKKADLSTSNEETKRILRTEIASTITVPDLRLEKRICQDFLISKIAFSRDGKLLAIGENTARALKLRVRLYHADTMIEKTTIEFNMGFFAGIAKLETDGVASLAFSHSNKFLFVGTRLGSVLQFDIERKSLVKRWIVDSSRITDLALSEDDQLLVTGSREGSIKWWNIDQTQMERHFQCKAFRGFCRHGESLFLFSDHLKQLPFSGHTSDQQPEKELMIPSVHLVSKDTMGILSILPGRIDQFNEDGILIRSIQVDEQKIGLEDVSVGFHGRILTRNYGRLCHVADLLTGKTIGRISGEAIFITAVDPIRSRLYVADNGNLEAYELNDSPLWRTLPESPAQTHRAIAASDGDSLVVSRTVDKSSWKRETFQKWGIDPLRLLSERTATVDNPHEFAVDHSARKLIFLHGDAKSLTELNMETGEERLILSQPMRVAHVSFDTHEKNVWFTYLENSSTSLLNKIRSWTISSINLNSGIQEFTWSNQFQQVTEQYSEITDLKVGDKHTIASTRDSLLLLSDRGEVRKTPVDFGIVTNIAFARSESECLVTTRNGVVGILDLVKNQFTSKMEAHTESISALFSRDNLVVLGDARGEVTIWDWEGENLRKIASLGPFGKEVTSLAVLKRSRFLAIHLFDEPTVRILDLQGLFDLWKTMGCSRRPNLRTIRIIGTLLS